MQQDAGEKDTILLLGGSRQQVVAIETAKRLGYRTVVCDYLPDNPGQYVADVAYSTSTTDREAVLEVARREHARGVLAYASDPAAPTAAYVAEELGLPTNPLRSVEVLSRKNLFRRHLHAHGFPCPASREVDATAVDGVELARLARDMRLPVVLKPTDSSGSKGISVLDVADVASFDRALAHARSFSRNGILELEEYISYGFPRVVGGDIFVARGEVRFWGLMSCLRDEELGGLVPVGERNPSGLTAVQERAVRGQIQDLVTSLDIQFGEFNVEVIVGPGNVPYFLELGARAGGNMIPVQLSDISGIDLVEANVRYAMGDDSMDVTFDGSRRAVCTYVPHARREGTFAGLELSADIEDHVYRTVMYLTEGDHVSRFDGANKAVGIVFLRFDDVEQMERLLDGISERIRVLVD
ncbi:hypothetical protein HF885_09430 [Olsenella umbonata]|uniref:ATP-grasp domain-containing protein n=1 Tax=Parafannyhessea umbonata TaxID=604330 RepID=A0A7X9TBX9_9ACTN|nr:hypothetical protein [Parafannyhessea umbonata]NMF26642.1 hypothetical protein [Parafannyhessea umbonata]